MGKNLIFGILFLKILFRTYNFSIFVQSCQWTSLEFFLILDLLAETLKAKKDHSFYNTVLLKKTSLILRTSTRLVLGITQPKIFLSLQIFWGYKVYIFLLQCQKTTTTTKTKQKQKTFALHHFLKAKNCIPVCIFLYIFMSVYLREKIFVPETY